MCEVTIFLWNNNIALGNMFAFFSDFIPLILRMYFL